VVLFDLDGTVSDSAASILRSLRQAFAAIGLAPLDPSVERGLLGPPFYESLPPLIGQHNLWPVIESYREHYATAMFDTTVFPGVAALLETLHEHGRRLAIATSKPEHYARPIVEHLGLEPLFETIGGDELDGSLRSKALVIEKVLSRLGRPDPADIVMVGDREHDVAGARAHGIDTIAVQWGYALPGELEAAAATAICATPSELAAALGVTVDAHR
jgi:phosphoglycolate phosphatase